MNKNIYKIGQLVIKKKREKINWLNSGRDRGRKYLQRMDRAQKQINKLVALELEKE
jgi:predicted metallo-beta-lactamase superfamily hydrolase